MIEKNCERCGDPFLGRNKCSKYCATCGPIMNAARTKIWKRNHSHQVSEQQKGYRSECATRSKQHFCQCGNVASKYKHNDYICDRCLQLEEYHEAREIRRERIGIISFGLPEFRLHLPA